MWKVGMVTSSVPTSGPSAGSKHRHLPAVDKVLAWPAVAALCSEHGRALVLSAVREELALQRAAAAVVNQATLQSAICQRVVSLLRPSLRRVFNLTGTVLHTNLGRAPLPPEALRAINEIASGACNLEFDLATGTRGDRDDHIEPWLQRLTGAPAATVVNNNAAALMLVLATLAKRREVIVSRGELVEIGGAFRLPDIMAAAGCRLREVGTTNRTRVADVAQAINAKTALVLKVHTSNYRIEGFTESPDERALATLCQERGLPFVVDLGSGAINDLARYGLPHEPTPAEALAAGADLVTFSGDKLLGGPQAGIVVGRADLIAQLKKNPFKRALRCDKLSLAALAAVLPLHGDPDRLAQRLPALRWLTRPVGDIAAQAQRLMPCVAAWLGEIGQVETLTTQSQIGSGALPVNRLASVALRLTPATAERKSGRALQALAARLRALPTPVIGRIFEGAVVLDLRCLENPQDEADFIAQLRANRVLSPA